MRGINDIKLQHQNAVNILEIEIHFYGCLTVGVYICTGLGGL